MPSRFANEGRSAVNASFTHTEIKAMDERILEENLGSRYAFVRRAVRIYLRLEEHDGKNEENNGSIIEGRGQEPITVGY